MIKKLFPYRRRCTRLYFAGQSILFVEEIVKCPATRLLSKDNLYIASMNN
jgi:hypothetical protein